MRSSTRGDEPIPEHLPGSRMDGVQPARESSGEEPERGVAERAYGCLSDSRTKRSGKVVDAYTGCASGKYVHDIVPKNNRKIKT